MIGGSAYYSFALVQLVTAIPVIVLSEFARLELHFFLPMTLFIVIHFSTIIIPFPVYGSGKWNPLPALVRPEKSFCGLPCISGVKLKPFSVGRAE